MIFYVCYDILKAVVDMYKIEFTNELIVNETGLAMVGKILDNTNLRIKINNSSVIKSSSCLIKTYDICAAYIGCLTQGKPEFARVDEYRENDFFKAAMHLKKRVPSEAILRQRLDSLGIHDFDSSRKIFNETNAELLKSNKVTISPKYQDYINIDIDVSPHDNSGTKKEGVSWTYKGMDGYAPIYAYIGSEGYMLNEELRNGSEHSQSKNTIPFLQQTLSLAKDIRPNSKFLVTLDSGHSCSGNIELFLNEKADFIIKKNNGRIPLSEIFDSVKKKYDKEQSNHDITRSVRLVPTRDGKEYYITSTDVVKYLTIDTIKNTNVKVRLVQECIKRTIDKKGQVLLFPEYEIKQYYTSLESDVADDDTVIYLYHQHATCEQFHSELKSDMDLERFPSGKFNTNQIVLDLACISFNILRMIGQANIRLEQDGLKVHRKRLKTVIKDIMCFASKIVKHARREYIKISKQEVFKDTFKNIFEYFCYG